MNHSSRTLKTYGRTGQNHAPNGFPEKLITKIFGHVKIIRYLCTAFKYNAWQIKNEPGEGWVSG